MQMQFIVHVIVTFLQSRKIVEINVKPQINIFCSQYYKSWDDSSEFPQHYIL